MATSLLLNFPTFQGKRFEHKIKLKEDQKKKLQKLAKENITINFGPNVNIKIPKFNLYSQEEKEWFEKKLKETKKTELCKNWVLYRDCFYKENCSFAHGENELRGKKAEKNKKYKTKICSVFIEKMHCLFGARCQYRHVISDKRIFKYSYLNNKFAENIFNELNKEENSKCDFLKVIHITQKVNKIQL